MPVYFAPSLVGGVAERSTERLPQTTNSRSPGCKPCHATAGYRFTQAMARKFAAVMGRGKYKGEEVRD
jgi:hypothetical protein